MQTEQVKNLLSPLNPPISTTVDSREPETSGFSPMDIRMFSWLDQKELTSLAEYRNAQNRRTILHRLALTTDPFDHNSIALDLKDQFLQNLDALFQIWAVELDRDDAAKLTQSVLNNQSRSFVDLLKKAAKKSKKLEYTTGARAINVFEDPETISSHTSSIQQELALSKKQYELSLQNIQSMQTEKEIMEKRMQEIAEAHQQTQKNLADLNAKHAVVCQENQEIKSASQSMESQWLENSKVTQAQHDKEKTEASQKEATLTAQVLDLTSKLEQATKERNEKVQEMESYKESCKQTLRSWARHVEHDWQVEMDKLLNTMQKKNEQQALLLQQKDHELAMKTNELKKNVQQLAVLPEVMENLQSAMDALKKGGFVPRLDEPAETQNVDAHRRRVAGTRGRERAATTATATATTAASVSSATTSLPSSGGLTVGGASRASTVGLFAHKNPTSEKRLANSPVPGDDSRSKKIILIGKEQANETVPSNSHSIPSNHSAFVALADGFPVALNRQSNLTM